jgi:adenylate kinase family enzyme
MPRVAILGNSGAGKSTVARWLSARAGAPHLELDSVAWTPGEIAVARAADDALADVRTFCARHNHWVAEGCYASLVAAALEREPLLLFLNPGLEQCLANCRARPWEPHKYRSRQEQDERLAFLLAWVREYYTRDGDMSLLAHRECFGAYRGPKQEVSLIPRLDPVDATVLRWLS